MKVVLELRTGAGVSTIYEDQLPLPLTTVSLRVAQFVARQQPFVGDFNMPLAEFRFIEMPARYRSFNPASDVRQIVGGVQQCSPSFHLD